MVNVSVLLPFRDAEATLGEALESVLRDAGPDAEVLCVDDHSTDGGAALVQRAAAHDPRVRLLAAEGRGIVAALGTGLHHAAGPFITRMDADDVSLPGRFEALAALLREHPDVSVASTQVELFGDAPLHEGMQRYVAWQNGVLTPAAHDAAMFVESPLCHPTVMVRREALLQVGGYREAPWAEDYDLWLRLHAAGHRFQKVPRVLYRWRQSPAQLTRTDRRYSVDAFRDARAAHLAPQLAGDRRAIVIWGAGPTGKRLARALETHRVRASAFVDIDPRKIGGVARGAPVWSPDRLDAARHFVVAAVGSWGARDLIRANLLGLGFQEVRDFRLAA